MVICGRRRLAAGSLVALAALVGFAGVAEAVVPRTAPYAGTIVGAKGEEAMRLLGAGPWLAADVDQHLLAGDELRTGPYGALAVLFADQTTIRVHADSDLVVKALPPTGGADLALRQGAVWARDRVGSRRVRIETPSATAAVRGTDWSLSVADGRTTLVVLAGAVELSNAQGSVTVHRGEIATAEIGRAPAKTVFVHPRDRAEMDLYLDLGDILHALPSLAMPPGAALAVRKRLSAVPAGRRSADQWAALADAFLASGDLAQADAAVARARAARLSRQAAGRAAYAAGFLAAFRRDPATAERDLAAAAGRLHGPSRLTALVGRYLCLVRLRRTGAAEAVLREIQADFGAHPLAAMARAWLLGYQGKPADGLAVLAGVGRAAGGAWAGPVAAVRAMLDELLGDGPAMGQAARQAVAADPGLPLAWRALAAYRANFTADTDGTVAAARTAAKLDPGDPAAWTALGSAWQDAEEPARAEAAFRRAVALDPGGPLGRERLALLLVAEGRMADANKQVAALEAAPAGRSAAGVRGAAEVAEGNLAAARPDLLAAAAEAPQSAAAEARLAALYYAEGNLPATLQALDNADRLDPNGIQAPLMRAVVSIDHDRIDPAIRASRQALRRLDASGYGLGSIPASRAGASDIGDAFYQLNLTDWARFYADRSYSDFDPSSHLFRGVLDPGVVEGGTDVLQGFLLDPLSVGGRLRYADLVRRPFNDQSLEGDVSLEGHGVTGIGEGVASGFSYAPAPFAYYVDVKGADGDRDRTNTFASSESVTAQLGAQPSAGQHLYGLFQLNRGTQGVPGQMSATDPDDRQDSWDGVAGLGYSLDLGGHDKILAAATVSRTQATAVNADALGTGMSPADASLTNAIGLAATRAYHAQGLYDLSSAFNGASVYGVGAVWSGSYPLVPNSVAGPVDTKSWSLIQTLSDQATVGVRRLTRYGAVDVTYGGDVAGTWDRLGTTVSAFTPSAGGVLVDPSFNYVPFFYGGYLPASAWQSDRQRTFDVYAFATWRVTPALAVAGGSALEGYWDDMTGGRRIAAPRLTVAWRPVPDQWLRLSYRRDMQTAMLFNLAPMALLGVQMPAFPLSPGGLASMVQGRWDAEWTPHVFTFLEADRTTLHDMMMPVTDSFDVVTAAAGRIQSLSSGLDLWAGNGVGAFAVATVNSTRNTGGGADEGRPLPTYAERQGQLGVTWISPGHLHLTATETVVGPHTGDAAGAVRLGGYATTDLSAVQYLADNRVALKMSVLNLLDRRYQVFTGIPSPGRTFLAGAQVRF